MQEKPEKFYRFQIYHHLSSTTLKNTRKNRGIDKKAKLFYETLNRLGGPDNGTKIKVVSNFSVAFLKLQKKEGAWVE